MELFLVRHAIAVDRSPDIPDAERPLTARGEQRFRRVVRGLARLDLRLHHLLHSPWTRAAHTAALMQPLVRAPLEPTPLLAEPPGQALLDRVARFPEAARIGLVGHEPWLGALLSLLLTATTDHTAHFALKKGGVAWIEGYPRPGAMTLRALLPPRMLRRLAGPA